MPSDALTLAVVLVGTGVGALIDVRTGRVPNVLTASLAAVGFAVAAAGFGRIDMPAAFAGCLLGLTLMLPGYLVGATGGGDVKLVAATGTLLGPMTMVWAVAFTLIAGGALALMVAVYRGRLRLTLFTSYDLVRTAGGTSSALESVGVGNRFAYAPAIAVGSMFAAVFA